MFFNRVTVSIGRCLSALAAAGLLALSPAPAWAESQVQELVLNQNFPDPDIVKSGATYHAYATNVMCRCQSG